MSDQNPHKTEWILPNGSELGASLSPQMNGPAKTFGELWLLSNARKGCGMMTKFSTEQAIAQIINSISEGTAIEFANTNPHWWIGYTPNLKCWMSYECCDDCDQNWFEDNKSIERLQKDLKNHMTDQWYLV